VSRFGRGQRVAVLGAVAALALLWIPPGHLPMALVSGRAAALAAHVLIFGGLAWGVGRTWGGPLHGGWLWLAVAMVSGVGEGLQPYVGRSAEWLDWAAGLAGAAWICAGLNRWPVRRQWGGLLVISLLPAGWAGAMAGLEARDFPALARPGALWSRQGWMESGVQISSRDGAFRLDRSSGGNSAGQTPYPGVFRRPVVSDWRRARALATRIYWPGPEAALVAVRVDDRPGNPPFSERFQKELTVTAGWNAIWIPAEELGRTSGGEPLDMGRIHTWGVFLVSDIPFDYFLLHTVHLDMPEEQP
jgi:hypothetical protein